MVKQTVKKKLTQIICIILAALMIVGIIVIALSGCTPQRVASDDSSVYMTENTAVIAYDC